MSKWIDADALMNQWCDEMCKPKPSCEEDCAVYDYVRLAPSIDIIFCKECRHSFINENHPQKPRICGLTKKCGTTKDDWFCADGERREP